MLVAKLLSLCMAACGFTESLASRGKACPPLTAGSHRRVWRLPRVAIRQRAKPFRGSVIRLLSFRPLREAPALPRTGVFCFDASLSAPEEVVRDTAAGEGRNWPQGA